MDADELRKRFYRGEWPHPHVVDVLDADVLFRALYGVFLDTSRPKDAFYNQQIAGQLLLELLPDPHAPLVDLVADSLDNWNISVEELPWYFEREHG